MKRNGGIDLILIDLIDWLIDRSTRILQYSFSTFGKEEVRVDEYNY